MRDGAARDKIWRVRAWQIVPIALVLTGAVACTGGSGGGKSDPPTPRPTSSVESSPSSTAPTTSARPTTAIPSVATTGPNVRPGEKPPALTALSKSHSTVGALQFAALWLRALDWGYATTDSTLARRLFGTGCAECGRFANNFDRAKAEGDHFTGGRLSYRSSTLVHDDNRHPGTTVVDIVFNQEAIRIVSGDGKTKETEKQQLNVRYREWLSWTSGSGWSVQDFQQVVVRK